MSLLRHCARLETKGNFCFRKIADGACEAKVAGYKVLINSLTNFWSTAPRIVDWLCNPGIFLDRPLEDFQLKRLTFIHGDTSLWKKGKRDGPGHLYRFVNSRHWPAERLGLEKLRNVCKELKAQRDKKPSASDYHSTRELEKTNFSALGLMLWIPAAVMAGVLVVAK
jgi:hypothetical protein